MSRDTEPKPPARRRRWRLFAALAAVGAAAILGGVGLILTYHQGEATTSPATPAPQAALVETITPKPGVKDQQLVLPGTIEAFYEASIFARVSGYLKMWYQDIGAHVKAGELLAEIDAPELDQQLAQAKNDLASVQASAALADLTAKRWKSLLGAQAVSQQTADEKAGDAVAKRAQVAAAQSNVARLQAMEDFKRIVAPFNGVVTARKTDIGALINAGSGTGVELFKVADLHEMRVYVRVPQAFLPQLHPGLVAKLKLPQYPDETFDARLATTSNAVTAESRTVLVELMADNPKGRLWPGTFAEVHFVLPPDEGIYRIPSSALLFRQHGLQVATVGADNRVTLKPITVQRDLGQEVEVASGLAADDRVIDSPSDSLVDGDVVNVEQVPPPAPAKTATKKQTAGADK